MKSSAILLYLSVLFCLATQAQDIRSFALKTNTQAESKPIEKIHLHLDKQHYTAGEIIWLKAYTVIGIPNLLSNLSSIINVELIAPEGKIVDHLKVPLASGIGLGDITLIDTLREGTYRLRAYSNWMRNDSATYFFDQNIHINLSSINNSTKNISVLV